MFNLQRQLCGCKSEFICPSPWFGMDASHSVQVFFFFTKKSLSHSGRFGVGETKHERKVLYPGIGGEGGGSSLYSLWVVCQIVKWKRAIWSDHCKHVGILHDKLWLRIWPCYQLPLPPRNTPSVPPLPSVKLWMQLSGTDPYLIFGPMPRLLVY